MIQILNDLIITLILQKLFCFQVRTWHNGTAGSFPVSRICINVSRSKRERYSYKIAPKDKGLPLSFFFYNERRESRGKRNISRNFNFRREICITQSDEKKGGRKVSEPKEAVNLLSLGHFCARTANKKGSGGQDRFPAKLFSRDSRETSFTRRNFKDEEVWKLLRIRENWG